MKNQNFSEWLKAQGIDESTMGIVHEECHNQRDDRRAQMMRFYQQSLLEPAPLVGADAKGKAIKAGDKVTITYVVSRVHPVYKTGQTEIAGTTINLDRIMPDGSTVHTYSCPSEWVERV